MKSTLKIFLSILILKNSLLFSQDKNKILILINDSIKYKILLIGPTILPDEKYQPTKQIVLINLSDEEKNYYQTLSINEWVKLLSDTKTDWATNLILYWLFEKEASKLKLGKNKWKKIYKAKEIDVWKSFLVDNISKANWIR